MGWYEIFKIPLYKLKDLTLHYPDDFEQSFY